MAIPALHIFDRECQKHYLNADDGGDFSFGDVKAKKIARSIAIDLLCEESSFAWSLFGDGDLSIPSGVRKFKLGESLAPIERKVLRK